MTNYQKTLSKRNHTRGGPNYQTGLLPAIPALGSVASTAGSWLASLGIGATAGKLVPKLAKGGKSAAKKGAGAGKKAGSAVSGTSAGKVGDIVGAGITGFTLGDITGGKLPAGLGGMDVGNLALGAGLLIGSGWLGIKGDFKLDTPLTPVSGAGMLAGGLLLYTSWNSGKEDGEN